MFFRQKKLIPIVLAIIMLLSIVAAGCSNTDSSKEKGGKDGKQIELRVAWWGSQNRHDRTLKVIDLFTEKNPDIKISPEFLGWDGYWEKMATQAAGKQLPDVMQMDDAYLADYVARELLVDMTPYVKSSNLNLSDVSDSFYGSGKMGEQLYALSLGANAVAMAYDPAMFEKAGVEPPKPGYSWDEYDIMVRELKAKLGDGVYGTTLTTGVDEFKMFLLQRGAYLYNDDGTALGYDDDQYFVDFFTFWNRLRKDKIVPSADVMATIQGLEDQPIVHGKSPFVTFHSNQIVALTNAANRPLKMIEYPSNPKGQKAEYLKPSQYFSVTSHSKNVEAAIKFVDFFTSDAEANQILGGERGVPISSKVRDALAPMLEDAAKESFDYIDYISKNYPPLLRVDPAGSGEINESLYSQISEQINFDQITPEEGAKKFRQEATKILTQNKK